MAKVGDTVRYLDSVGGGIIARIEGNVAYVDEDGFETPVLLKNCVVVSEGDAKISKGNEYSPQKIESEPKKEKATQDLPVIETPEGDKINLVLGFEPESLLQLSDIHLYSYIVNDSNYYIYFTYSTSDNKKDWNLRYAGIVEPNIQLLIEELNRETIVDMDYIKVQAIAFKRDKSFESKIPYSIECRFDATKFFKRHSFKPDDYFDSDVIAIHLITDDRPFNSDIEKGTNKVRETFELKKEVGKQRPVVKKKKPANTTGDEVVDLHINELLDNTSGMSNSEILNYQIDEFRKVMDRNLKNKGKKLIFIHGKGEGVLRNALLKELNHRYKEHDVQDASFREYGFGATQVTIR